MFGARAEYGLHTVVNIGLQGGGAATSRSLAEFQQLPLAFVRKLLSDLGRAGLLLPIEGAAGGWQLARAPEAMSVLDVVDAVQPDASLFECREVRSRCVLWPNGAPPAAATSGTCSIHRVMLDAEAAARSSLAAVTVADLLESVRGKSSARHLLNVHNWFADQRVHLRATAEGRS
jgi:Rrf2 family protein